MPQRAEPEDPAAPDETILVSGNRKARKNKIYHDPDADCRYVERAETMMPRKRSEFGPDWRLCRECSGESNSGSNNGVPCPRCGEIVFHPSSHIRWCDGEGSDDKR